MALTCCLTESRKTNSTKTEMQLKKVKKPSNIYGGISVGSSSELHN
jgi:hypothetical protein